MRARDVIVIARRRAGLTQQQLARRLGVPQVTVARWESGTTEPKFDAVQKAVGACGLDLTLGFANADEGSWNPLIYEQLLRTPAERVRMLSPGGLDRVEALKFLGALGPRVIIVGETAGALHGWPLVLDGSGGIDLLVHREDRGRVEDAFGTSSYPGRFRLLDEVPGAWGYADLARNAVAVEVEGAELQVAALVDLLRIAHTANTRYSRRFAQAFDETLQLTERLRRSASDTRRKLSERDAREEVDRWLERQAAA